MWAAATASQPPASPGRDGRAAEGEEHLLGDVLGLVPRPQHPGGDADDAGVVGAEHLLEVGADAGAGRRSRHSDAVLPSRPGSGPRPRTPRSGAAVAWSDPRCPTRSTPS